MTGAPWELASAAARRAGVTLTELDTDGAVRRVQPLIASVWGEQQVPQANLLRALAHAGATLIGADRDGDLLGFVLGFLGWSDGVHLHSHMAAVLPAARSHGVGYALKLAQRAVCLDNGVDEVRWTYDPLIGRNAHFNLVKLGALPRRFLPDFYGAMEDAVNAGDFSDRFEVSWPLRSQRVERALAAVGMPTPPPAMRSVQVPSDYARLRRTSPPRAREWRLRCRAEFANCFDEGLTPVWFDDSIYHFVPADVPLVGPTSSGTVASEGRT